MSKLHDLRNYVMAMFSKYSPQVLTRISVLQSFDFCIREADASKNSSEIRQEKTASLLRFDSEAVKGDLAGAN